MVDVVVVGAGHNGLVAACYLARAGLDVVVLEAQPVPGGGSRTAERTPGYRFDLHSVAHNMIQMTSIPDDLDLRSVGLDYQEMDPFSVAVHADGRRVRFFRSLDATVESIAETDPEEAVAYRSFIEDATPLVRLMVASVGGDAGLGRVLDLGRAARRGVLRTIRDVLSPAESLLARRLPSELTRGPIAAFAAHAGVGPSVPGSAAFALWQAAYHLHGQWHARGGAGSLIDALVTRLAAEGGEVRCSTRVERITTRFGRVVGVATEDGGEIRCRAVVTACDPRRALLDLLDPPLSGAVAEELRAARRGNVVQALVHIATDKLPPYPGARPGDWNGLQSLVDNVGDLSNAWAEAEAGLLPAKLPLYAFSTSAIDPTLAPPGHHTVYLACPAAPAEIRGGWEASTERFVDAAVDAMDARAPGFRESIIGLTPWTPLDMIRDESWPGAHPMHLDIALDQLGLFRPVPALAGHRTEVEGLYITGAGTAPAGGISGAPGRAAANALLRDRGRRRRTRTPTA